MHDQFTWAILKPSRSYFQSSLRHLPILFALVIMGMFWLMRIAKSIDGPEKIVLFIFFLVIFLAIAFSINHYWQMIGSVRGRDVTKYEINETEIIINNLQKIPLTSIDKNFAMKLVETKLKPYAEWSQSHLSDGQPISLTLMSNTGPLLLNFATDYDQQHLLRSLKQFFKLEEIKPGN